MMNIPQGLKVYILSMLLLSLFSSIHAQNKIANNLSDFKLSDYKLADVNQQRLNLDFGFSLSSRQFNSFNNNDILGNFSPTYFTYRNTRKYQGEGSYNLRTSFFKNSNQRNTDFTNKRNLTRLGFSVNVQNRFYKNEKLFFELDLIADEDFTNRTLETNNSFSSYEESFERSNELNISLPLGIGIGRIESVEDARLALFILQDLEEKGKTKGNISPELCLDFAKHISKVRWKRVLDFRMQNQYQVEAVDSFLRDKDIINDYDAAYYTSIMDLLRYNWLPRRSHGNRLSFHFTPSIISIFNDQETHIFEPEDYNTQNIKLNSFQYLGHVDFRVAKAISLQWQWDFFAKIGAGFENGNRTYEINEPTIYSYNAFISRGEFSTRIGYYPNSRTFISVNLGSYLFNDIGTESEQNGNQGAVFEKEYQNTNVNFNSSIEIFYWFAPNFSINLNAGMNLYSVSNNSQNILSGNSLLDGSNNYLDIGLLYSIF